MPGEFSHCYCILVHLLFAEGELSFYIILWQVCWPLKSSCCSWTRRRDVQTGTHLASFKDSASNPNAISVLGQDYLVAAQAAKGVLHFWTWHKVSCISDAPQCIKYGRHPCQFRCLQGHTRIGDGWPGKHHARHFELPCRMLCFRGAMQWNHWLQ